MTGFSVAIRAALGVTLALQTVHAAQAKTDDCLLAKEAEALFLMAMPVAIEEMKKKCAVILPAESYLLRNGSNLAKRFDAASADRQGEAIAGFHRFSGWVFEDMNGEALVPMMRSKIGSMMVTDFKSTDCGSIDRVFANLDPLPPKNFAGALIAIMQIKTASSPSAEGEIITGAMEMPICPASTKP